MNSSSSCRQAAKQQRRLVNSFLQASHRLNAVQSINIALVAELGREPWRQSTSQRRRALDQRRRALERRRTQHLALLGAEKRQTSSSGRTWRAHQEKKRKTRTGNKSTETGKTPQTTTGGAEDSHGAGRAVATGRHPPMRRATFRKSRATTATATRNRKGSKSTKERLKASWRSLRR